MPSGKIMKTRSRARKSSTGFDLTKLFIGAEGTLGIVTEATLRLTPLIPNSVAIMNFPTIRQAVEASTSFIASGALIQCVELVGSEVMAFGNRAGLLTKTYPERETLMVKLQGPEETLIHVASLIKKLSTAHGGSDFEVSTSYEEAESLWAMRKMLLLSGLKLNPGTTPWITDACVPLSSLPEIIEETKENMNSRGLSYGIAAHVGDGNFHASMFTSTEDEEKSAKIVVHDLAIRAIKLGGTCTGEHGVGLGKKEFLVDELGIETVTLMETIKSVIDPLNLFNPGKLYPHI